MKIQRRVDRPVFGNEAAEGGTARSTPLPALLFTINLFIICRRDSFMSRHRSVSAVQDVFRRTITPVEQRQPQYSRVVFAFEVVGGEGELVFPAATLCKL